MERFACLISTEVAGFLAEEQAGEEDAPRKPALKKMGTLYGLSSGSAPSETRLNEASASALQPISEEPRSEKKVDFQM